MEIGVNGKLLHWKMIVQCHQGFLSALDEPFWWGLKKSAIWNFPLKFENLTVLLWEPGDEVYFDIVGDEKCWSKHKLLVSKLVLNKIPNLLEVLVSICYVVVYVSFL